MLFSTDTSTVLIFRNLHQNTFSFYKLYIRLISISFIERRTTLEVTKIVILEFTESLEEIPDLFSHGITSILGMLESSSELFFYLSTGYIPSDGSRSTLIPRNRFTCYFIITY